MKIGILTHDNGEYDVYVAHFEDPDKLKAAVAVLNAERLDLDSMEPANADVLVITLQTVPDIIDDAFLDILASHLSEAGVEIERTHEKKDRMEEEAQERELERQEDEQRRAEPIVRAPGQERMGL